MSEQESPRMNEEGGDIPQPEGAEVFDEGMGEGGEAMDENAPEFSRKRIKS